jgi:hypothetical protein
MAEVRSLAGLELDVAVARAEIAGGALDIRLSDAGIPTIATEDGGWEPFRPSVNWVHAGPIVEREWTAIVAELREWYGDQWANPNDLDRAEMLLWLMRAYVASKA